MMRRPNKTARCCQIQAKRRTDDFTTRIIVTFANGVEETFDATSITTQHIRGLILDKGRSLKTEQMFKEAGEKWPVVIPEQELQQPFTGIKPKKAEDK